MTTEELIQQYGPFKVIDRKREVELLADGKWRYLFTITEGDEEDGDETWMEGVVGHHLVNVTEIFESAKPMPPELLLNNDELSLGTLLENA